MKRAELKRKHPWRPERKPLKRTRLNAVSKDKRSRDRDNKPFLDKYRREFPRCQCGEGCGRLADEIHEIAGGHQHRWKCRQSRACVLHLNHDCHDRCQGEQYARGLARKKIADPEGYDRAEFLRVIRRAPGAITEAQVNREVKRIQKLAA